MANHLYYGDNLDILREHILEHGLTRVGERDFLAQSGTAISPGRAAYCLQCPSHSGFRQRLKRSVALVGIASGSAQRCEC